MEKYLDQIKEGIKKNEVVTIFANCSVVYDGRAQSFLDKGDRLVIIKRDGTLLIHQPDGNAPVNYMKPRTAHSISNEEGVYLLKASNLIDKEYLDLFLHEVYSVSSKRLDDNEKLQLNGSEKDMSDMIYDNPSLISSEFKPLSREERTKYGFIDVFGMEGDDLVVIECKRYSADLAAVTQLRRYVEKIKEVKGVENVKGIIAAPKISTNALKMLEDWGFFFKAVNPPNYLERHSKKQMNLDSF